MTNRNIPHTASSPPGLKRFSDRIFLDQKMNNWLGYIIFSLFAVGVAWLMANNLLIGIGFTGLILALTIALICLLSTEAGLYILMTYSFFVNFFSRFLFEGGVQAGIFSDILILITFLSLVVRRVNFRQSINAFTKAPAVVMLLLVYCYMAIELFNPSALSFNGWFQAFRKILGTLFILFISFNLFNSYARIRRFMIVLFCICCIAALYGCIQQWHGLFNFEMDWIMSHPHEYGLIFIDGEFRKFSTMSDPCAYAMVMAACSVFYMAVAGGKKRALTKFILTMGVLLMLLGGSYSGIRTANGMVIAGLVMFILLTFDRKSSRILSLIAGFIFLFLMYAPIYTPNVEHFRATFKGTKDESYNVRDVNRKSVQPYIYTHPIGGGLGTTGAEGLAFNPGHELAGFPPDSGLLKKALEIGWIGFTMLCVLYFLILRTGIQGYFACRNEKIKLIYAGVTSAIYAFYLGDFSQEAIGQISDVVIYYPFIAILLRLKEFDQSNSGQSKSDQSKSDQSIKTTTA